MQHQLGQVRRYSSSSNLSSSSNSSFANTKLFFEWLERRYGARFGGKPLPMDNNCTNNCTNTNNGHTNANANANQIITTNALTVQHLNQLFRHEISVLKVKNFFPKRASAALGKQLERELHSSSNSNSNSNSNSSLSLSRAQNWKVSTAYGLESSDVFTLGKHAPYNIALANQSQDEYFQGVRQELKHRRNTNTNTNTKESASSPLPTLHPLDLLRLELDELWPSGAGLARANHKASHKDCMGGGLPRLMVGPTRWKKGLVHVDELAPLDDQKGCFSANVYLQLPYENDNDNDDDDNDDSTATNDDEQPVMEVWPLGIRSKWDWYRNATTLSHLASQDTEGQVILRKALGDDHKLRVSAAPGDLVLLCVQRPHCAIGFGHETPNTADAAADAAADGRRLQTRVSLQCFLQFSGDDKRLTIDS